MLVARGVGVERLGAVDYDFRQLRVEVLEDLLGEAGADVADGFVGFRGGAVGGEEEGAKDRGAFAFAVVGA